MVWVTVARRVTIFLLFIGLLMNGIGLVLARGTNARQPDQSDASFKLQARFKDKAAADDLADSVKKEKAALAPRTTVSKVTVNDEVPTGKFTLSLSLKTEDAEGIVNILKKNYAISEETAGNMTIVRLQETFNSKAEAQARVDAVEKKANGLVKMQVVEAKKKVPSTVYRVEIVVADEDSLESVTAFVKSKAPDAIEH